MNTDAAQLEVPAETRIPPGQQLPMFYQQLVRMDPGLHLGYGVTEAKSFSAMQAANAVPLGAGEFWAASRSYPIVFGPAGAAAFPLAVTGLVEGSNLFVDNAGQWRADAYQPLWIQRYPFWMIADESATNASLWFDPAAGSVQPLQDYPDAAPLFDYQGQANQAIKDIAQLCQLCSNEAQGTLDFMAALEQQQLLVTRDALIELTPGTAPYKLSGFRVIDLERYAKLPDALLAEWVRNGWAGLIALHAVSCLHNWQRLLALHRARNS